MRLPPDMRRQRAPPPPRRDMCVVTGMPGICPATKFHAKTTCRCFTHVDYMYLTLFPSQLLIFWTTFPPAKYRDPVTRMPYASLEAFKELRSKHASSVQGEGEHDVTYLWPVPCSCHLFLRMSQQSSEGLCRLSIPVPKSFLHIEEITCLVAIAGVPTAS